MPQGFRYDERTGAAVAAIHASTDDGFNAQVVPGYGIIQSDAPIEDVWVSDGMVLAREPLELAQDAYTILLGDTLAIGVPDDAFLMNETAVLKSDGVVTFTPRELGETRLRFVGRYKAPDILVRVTSLEVERVALRAAIDVEKQAVIDGGVTHAGHVWDADPESQEALKGAVQTAQLGLLPADFYWTDRNNVSVPCNADALKAIAQAVIGVAFAAHNRAQVLKAAVEQATTLAELEAIDIAEGWPV